MTANEIAADIKRHTGAGMVTAKQVAEYMGCKKTQYIRDKHLIGLERIGNRYWVNDVAKRLKEACEIGGG